MCCPATSSSPRLGEGVGKVGDEKRKETDENQRRFSVYSMYENDILRCTVYFASFPLTTEAVWSTSWLSPMSASADSLQVKANLTAEERSSCLARFPSHCYKKASYTRFAQLLVAETQLASSSSKVSNFPYIAV